MGILKIVEWPDDSKTTIVHKFDLGKNEINKGSMLVVRDGQVAIFADKGKMADVFLPGTYKLDTDNIPVITRLLSWKYGFERPFKSDIYFVKTTQFIGQKWGTTTPIIMRDKDYGAVRVRGFGNYSFRVSDAFVFMQELSGSGRSYATSDIVDYLRSLLISKMTEAFGKSQVPILEAAANLGALANTVKTSIAPSMESLGIQVSEFNIENFSMPEELEKMLDKSTGLNMMKGNVDVYTQMAAADAMVAAAKNPGTAGTMMGAGMGIGMGVGIGNVFGNAFGSAMNGPTQQGAPNAMVKCTKCGAGMQPNAKFCPECGQKNGVECPKCKASVPAGTKFCPECGENLSASKKCECGADLNGGKFCPECGKAAT
ncbi:MAG: SPFH domain-containing protein [Firmicutes bacterium]|nr:SPFH domain-containing protein [Bacillota bacterium]